MATTLIESKTMVALAHKTKKKKARKRNEERKHQWEKFEVT